MSALHKEIEFENDICAHLAAHDWLYAENDYTGYDRARALFPADVTGLGAGHAAAGMGDADQEQRRSGGSRCCSTASASNWMTAARWMCCATVWSCWGCASR